MGGNWDVEATYSELDLLGETSSLGGDGRSTVGTSIENEIGSSGGINAAADLAAADLVIRSVSL